MCVAAAKTNLKPGPVRSTKLDHCAGQDVEGADALGQGYADHDISSTDERPNAGADRPIKARHRELARGRHHAREVKARVMICDAALDHSSAGTVFAQRGESDPTKTSVADPAATTRPSSSTTTIVAKRATSATLCDT